MKNKKILISVGSVVVLIVVVIVSIVVYNNNVATATENKNESNAVKALNAAKSDGTEKNIQLAAQAVNKVKKASELANLNKQFAAIKAASINGTWFAYDNDVSDQTYAFIVDGNNGELAVIGYDGGGPVGYIVTVDDSNNSLKLVVEGDQKLIYRESFALYSDSLMITQKEIAANEEPLTFYKEGTSEAASIKTEFVSREKQAGISWLN